MILSLLTLVSPQAPRPTSNHVPRPVRARFSMEAGPSEVGAANAVAVRASKKVMAVKGDMSSG